MAKLSTDSLFGLAGGMGKGMSFALAQADRAERNAERDYQRALKALDQRKWEEAIAALREVGKPRGDAALYWTSYAQNKLGRRDQALLAIQTLINTYPTSAWLNDAKALELEVKQAAGQAVSPESETDEELKLMALNSLMNSDPERSLPLLEGLLKRSSSPQLKERALFVLSQNRSPKAREIVMQIAKGGSNPDLQRRAVRNLGIHGGKENRQALMEIYPTARHEIKRDILRSFMTSGERDYLLNVAKTDQNPELRREAIHLLGTMGAQTSLAELYGAESSTEVKAAIMHAMFISGNSDKLIELARTEKDQKLRLDAIHKLGTMGREKTADALTSLYASDADVEVRKRILHSLFIQNSARQLVDIARKETNLELKKQAVHWLSLTKSKEATDYLLELLK
jgi:HEAT repeat protein